MPARILSAISDVIIDDRMGSRIYREWQCPETMAFMIVLPEDAEYQGASSSIITRCETKPDPINPSSELTRLRQSLYQEDWWIDMRNRCVVPKSTSNVVPGSCYGKDESQTTYPINYDDFQNGCGFDHIGQGNNLGLCPHFVSVCIRATE